MTLIAEHYDASEGQIETENPRVEAAFLAIQVVEKKAAVLKTIGLYEQRINRTLQIAITQFQDMAKTRKEREEKEMLQASQILKVQQMKGEVYNPQNDGFVFSSKQFEQFLNLAKHIEEVGIARSVRWNAKKFAEAVSYATEPRAS